MEAERGIDMGAVEVDGAEPVLRGTGGSEEPLSISDTGDRTWICCWEEGPSLRRTLVVLLSSSSFCSHPDITGYVVILHTLNSFSSI